VWVWVCVCVGACVRACLRVWVWVWVFGAGAAASELLSVLLSLEDADAAGARQAAVVALVVAWPDPLAGTLAQEVWDRQYTLGRRMQVLEMVAAAAEALAAAAPTADAVPSTSHSSGSIGGPVRERHCTNFSPPHTYTRRERERSTCTHIH
jgi:hypothetical protein